MSESKKKEPLDAAPRVMVVGVGGAGGAAIDTMIEKNLEGVEFLAANTDAQALGQSKSPQRLRLGDGCTSGLGAGGKPAIGAQAAEESAEDVKAALSGVNMAFIAAGMGGGTGTGAAPVIAQIAKEMGVLTVAVVSKPFDFEGGARMAMADEGVEALRAVVDTLIVIPNQNLFRIANERTTLIEAFILANDVLYQGVKGVTDLIVRAGMVNLDFADVRAVIDGSGRAMMGAGEAEGERRALEAAEQAIENPLLDEAALRGAKGVLISITGGPDLKLFEVDEAANRIRRDADPDAAIFFGSTLDPTLDGRIRVSVVATGVAAAEGEIPARDETAPMLTAPLEAARAEPAPAPAEACAESPTEVVAAPAPTSAPAVAEETAPEPEAEIADAEVVEPAAALVQRAPDAPVDAAVLETEPAAAAASSRETMISRMTNAFDDAADAVADSMEGAPALSADPRANRVDIPSFLRRSAAN